MKKALTVVLAVAILGILGFFVNKNRKEDTSAASQTSSVSQVSAANSTQTQDESTNSAQSEVYKDGSYTESSDTPYGAVKITVVISGGKIDNVVFVDMPNDEDRSTQITATSSPQLKQNAIKAQSANIDFVSGATSTSYGFQESLQAALDAAKAS